MFSAIARSPQHASADEPAAGEPGAAGPSVGGLRYPWVLAGLAGAWLVPFATHAIGVDAILVPLIVVAAMSLVRSVRSVLDQFMVATVLLFGATVLLGLLASVWPWGLHPVPVAGTELTALVLIASRRRPRLMMRLRIPDRLALLSIGMITLLALTPFIRYDLAGRLKVMLSSEDFARHFVLFDSIGLVNGYAFIHRAEALRYMPAGYGLETYPQGAHLVYQLLYRFWRSSTATPSGVAAMDWLLWCHVMSFVFMCAAVVWAVRRVAGPALDFGRTATVLGAVAAYLYFGDATAIYLGGFPNELIGLGLCAILVAVVARPLHDVREQVLLVAALLVGVSFTYYLFLPTAGVLAVAYLVVNRKRVGRRRWTTALAAVTASGALIPLLVNMRANTGTKLLLAGAHTSLKAPVLLALLFVVVAGMLTRRGWRTPSLRMAGFAIVTASVVAAGIAAYQQVMIGRTTYYYDKATHLVMVTALVGSAAAVRLVPRVHTSGTPLRRRLLPFAPLAALTLAVFAVLGTFTGDRPGVGSWGRLVLTNKIGNAHAAQRAIDLARRYPDGGGGKVTIDLAADKETNFYSTLYLSVMSRNYRSTVGWYVFMATWQRDDIARMEQELLATGRPVRFVVADPDARFLVVDRAAVLRASNAYPADTGDGRAMTNIEAAAYLQSRHPDQVEIVTENMSAWQTAARATWERDKDTVVVPQ